MNAGQVCTSAERFYVAREVYDDFVSAFVDHAHPAGGRSALRGHRRGPDGVGAAAREGRGAGGGRRRRGRRAGAGRRASRLAPRSLLRARATGPPGRDRSPGRKPSGRWRQSCRSTRSTRRSPSPTAPLRPGRERVHADLETAVRCLREIRAGTVWINDPLTDNDAGPFGGFKQSGIRARARAGGARGVPGDQARHIETKIAPKEWWYPYRAADAAPPSGAGA